MVSLLRNFSLIHLSSSLLFPTPNPTSPTLYHVPRTIAKIPTHRLQNSPSIVSASANADSTPRPDRIRTLYPGGFKRPEIKVPAVVLQLNCDDVLSGDHALSVIDRVVSRWAAIILLGAADGSGGRLYEAARVLKSVVRERAYLLIAERVDVASAVGASGVVLSDEGLPAIIARNMMMGSTSESVVLPLVARTVQSANAAVTASNSEGADFLILAMDKDEYAEVLVNAVNQQVKIPVFTLIDFLGEGAPFAAAAKLLEIGASGLVIPLKNMSLFSDDVLDQLFMARKMKKIMKSEIHSSNSHETINSDKGFYGNNGISMFTIVEKKEIEAEKEILFEAIDVIRKAAPLMEEVSLLVDAVSRLDDPFLLVIVGEFNSGKSTVINALLGRRYLNEGVVPTTNEITLLCYSDVDTGGLQRCQRHPDGQFMCYLPAPILRQMNVVDTPGTNVILQRQQRLTEEFVPRADLLLFVISADRPLTESEVTFLQYVQQWKKRVVFVLNKADIYQNNSELEEATTFIKDNARKLLNLEHVTLFPVSARFALKAKLSLDFDDNYEKLLSNDPRWKTSGFCELENFLFSFLDGSTENGIERMRLKLGTPIEIANRLLDACEKLVKQECEFANQDLISVEEIISSVKEYATKLEKESVLWKQRVFSLIETAQARAVKLTEATLQLSNLDLVASYFLKEKSGSMPVTLSIKNEIIDPALSDVQELLREYLIWLDSKNTSEDKRIRDSFEQRWPMMVNAYHQGPSETLALIGKGEELSMQVVKNFSPSAAAKLYEQEVREVVLGAFGGLGAAGLSASLLTSVLPTTLEDLLALGLCSAGGLLAISKFPTRRTEVADKVKRAALAFERELDEAMQKDFLKSIENLERSAEVMGRPYRDAAQDQLDRMLEIQEELSNTVEKLRTFQVEIQNLHIS